MTILFFIKQLYLSLIIFLTESDDDNGEYIAEDREMEARRNHKMAQRVQTAILQNLLQSLGVAATLPEEAAKDLILQVNLISLSIMSTITIQFVLTFLVIIYFLFFTGNLPYTDGM